VVTQAGVAKVGHAHLRAQGENHCFHSHHQNTHLSYLSRVGYRPVLVRYLAYSSCRPRCRQEAFCSF
jgi:hypothetical protein